MCDSLLTDLTRLREKQRQNTEITLRLVDSVGAALEGSLGEPTTPQVPHNSLEDIMPRLVQQHKTYHAALSKMTKSVDRIFQDATPPVFMCRPLRKEDLGLVDQMVGQHLYRRGRTRTAVKLVEEAGLSSSALNLQAHEALARVHEVIAAASRKRDLGPARAWAAEHREGLKHVGSNLEFKLARLQFIKLVAGDGSQGKRAEEDAKEEEEETPLGCEGEASTHQDDLAISFAREHLAPFAVEGGGNAEEVRKLMGSLLYAGRLDRSPYKRYLAPRLWAEAMEALHTEGCRMLGLPVESSLSVCYRASLHAMGPLAKMRQVVLNSKGDWEALEELPGGIEWGRDSSLRFHSVFSCPVTREQASRANPPMVLKCGHVICRNSLNRLLKPQTAGGRASQGQHRFKCFICPVEQTLHDAQQIYF